MKGSFVSFQRRVMAKLSTVAVLGVKNLTVPIPQQPTASTCTLNNGIHFVTTPEYRLGRDSRIDQEFELCVVYFVSPFMWSNTALGSNTTN